MQVKFDKLDRYEMPMFTLCNPGSTYSCGALTRVIGPICNTSDEEVEFNFNATSTLNFRVSKLVMGDLPETISAQDIYKSIQNRRLIFAEDIGYFIITDVNEGFENGVAFKDVTASSCEVEIQNKALVYIEDGTYLFTDLFERIISTIPKWTIDHVDDAVAERYRTFEDVDTTLNTFAFLMEEMQEAYECIFTYDTIHRTITVYDKNNYVVRTDIHLTRDDLINSLNVTENSDNLYTALSVFGDDELTVASVNPLGTTTIYNFDCYLDWMSDGLREKVASWSKLVNEYDQYYYDLNVQYYEAFSERANCSYEIERLTTQMDMYQQCRNNVVAESSGDKIDEYNDAITSNGGEAIDISDSIEDILVNIDSLIYETEANIQTQNDMVASIQSRMDAISTKIQIIHNEVAIENYFTQEEYDELYDYIYEGIYTDDYIITTDIMTMAEKLDQMRELYNRAKKSLQLAAFPDQEFTVDVEDFIFVKAFQEWSTQLETGSLINVELNDGDIAELFLVTIILNWEDKSLSLTFGNRFNRFDPKALFNDVLGNIQKSSNTINYIKEIIYPVKNGMLSELESGIQNARVLAVNDSLSSSNGEVLLNSTGYTGRKQTTDVGYASEQLKITANTIVFTEDAWSTCETILGYILLSDLTTKYGVNAKSIIGELIIGDRVVIRDKDGNNLFEIIDNKIELATTKILSELNVRVDGIEEDVAKRLAEVIASVGSISSSIGTVPAGTTVVQMIGDMNNSIADTNAKIAANTSAIAELQAQIDALSS